MPPWPSITHDEYCDHVLAAADRMATVVDQHPLDTAVPTCPGWDLRELAAHTGQVHRWAGEAAATAAEPVGRAGAPAPEGSDGGLLAAWLRSGADDLVATLRHLDPTASTWHVFPLPQVAGVWPRRQAHETAMHAWDAEHAVDAATGIDPTLAFDGVLEYFQLVLPRLVAREGVALPAGAFAVEAVDLGHALSARVVDGALVVTHDESGPDAVMRGPAAACLGRLWNRPMGDDVAIDGDADIVTAWLDLPGI